MPTNLDKWAGDTSDLTAPKPLQMAKALRQRKRALAQADTPSAALAGSGNVFQRRRAGIDAIVDQAVK